MYRTAHARDEEFIFYLDAAGNKYVASGGSLAWRLNNPGAILYLDLIDAKVIKNYTDQRIQYYQNELSRINNLTILDPDPDSHWKHRFSSDCYQTTIGKIIRRYRKKP